MKILLISCVEKNQKNSLKFCFRKIIDLLFGSIDRNKNTASAHFKIVCDLLFEFNRKGFEKTFLEALHSNKNCWIFMEQINSTCVNQVSVHQFKVLLEISQNLWKENLPKGFYQAMLTLFVKFIALLSFGKNDLKEKTEILLRIISRMSQNFNLYYQQKLQKKNLRGEFFKSIVNIMNLNKEMLFAGEVTEFFKKIKLQFSKDVEKAEKTEIDSQNKSNMKTKSQVEKMFDFLVQNSEKCSFDCIVFEEYIVSVLVLLKGAKFEFSVNFVAQIQAKFLNTHKTPLFCANLALFHLKNSNYDSFLELVTDFTRTEKVQIPIFYSELKRDLTSAQDFIKIITMLKFWKADNYFDMSDIKLKIGEYLSLITCTLNFSLEYPSFKLGSQNELSANFAMLVSKMVKNPQNTSDLFCLLKICWQFLLNNKHTFHFDTFVFKIIQICVQAIDENSSQVKFSKSEIEHLTTEDQSERRELNILTILQKFEMNVNLNLNFNFDQIKQAQLKIFIKLILVIYNINFISKNLRNNLNSIGFEDNENNPTINMIKTSVNYLMLFIENDPNNVFNLLKSLLSQTADELISITINKTIAVSNPKILSRFFDLFIHTFQKLNSLKIPNRTLKICELLSVFLQKLEVSSNNTLTKLLSQLTTSSKLFTQLLTLSDGKFSNSLNTLTSLNQEIFAGKNGFILVFAIITHLTQSTQKISDPFISKFAFKLFKRVQKNESSNIDFSFFQLINTFAKLIYGLKHSLNDVLSFLDNSEKQTLHFLRCLDPQTLERVSGISCQLFLEVIQDKLFLKFNQATLIENDLKNELVEFFLFVILNQIGTKKSSSKKDKDSNSQDPLFTAIKVQFVKRVSDNFLLTVFVELNEKLKNTEIFLPVLTHFLDIILFKFEYAVFSKTIKKNFGLMLNIILNDIIFEMQFTNSQMKKSENKFIKKSLLILNIFAQKNPNLTFKILLKFPNFSQKWFGLIYSIEDISLQLEIYRFLAILSNSKDDLFLNIFNELTQNFLSFSQMNLPKISDDKNLTSNFLSTFLDFFTRLISNFGNMIEPFIKDVLLVSTEVLKVESNASNKIHQLLELMASFVDFRIGFKHIEESVEYAFGNNSLELFEIVSLFTQNTIHKIEFDTFAEKHGTIFSVIEKSINLIFSFTANEQKINALKKTWIEIFWQFAIKCNEIQLKQYFAVFQKNTFKKQNQKQFFLRRNFLMETFMTISEKLGPFSIALYGEIFEFCVEFLNEVNLQDSKKKSHKEKRSSTESDPVLTISTHSYVMKSIELLLKNDKNGFIDSFKFEQLIQPILTNYTNFRFELERPQLLEYFEKSVHPALANLLLLVNDEYKTKSTVLALLKMCLEEEKTSKLLAIVGIKKVVGTLGEGFLVLVNDVVLKLSNLANDVDADVAGEVREVIKLIEEMAGEDVKEMLEREDLNFEA